MPWTRRQVKFLLSKKSPLTPDEEAKMKRELHENPALGHAKKKGKRDSEGHSYDWRERHGK